MGLYGHIEQAIHPGTIMGDTTLRTVTEVPEIDGVGLLAAYTQVESGTEPEDLDATALAYWNSTKTVFSGNVRGCACSFGTNLISGYAVPWVEGTISSIPLSESRLSGMVEWNGGFAGFTPRREAVEGGSTITVDLGTLTGSAAFTDLSFHDGGGMWDDGDLDWSIYVDGSYFISVAGVSGDDGYVAGQFVGETHKGMVGILERPDLTGAFGGVRE